MQMEIQPPFTNTNCKSAIAFRALINDCRKATENESQKDNRLVQKKITSQRRSRTKRKHATNTKNQIASTKGYDKWREIAKQIAETGATAGSFYSHGKLPKELANAYNLRRMDGFKQMQAFEVVNEQGQLIYHHHKGAVKWCDAMINCVNYKLQNSYNVKRGNKTGGISCKYVCSGLRKEPLGQDVGSYRYKTSTDASANDACENGISKINKIFTSKVSKFLPNLEKEMQRTMKNFIHIKAICRDQAAGSQFSIGTGYWSVNHVDKDMSYSILGVHADDECIDDANDIVYYFCFPDYGIKVPMRTGDLLVFNPLIHHSCSNPLRKNATIFSQYTSQKTMLTKACIEYSLN
jgi:hypothetical protein